MTFAVVEGRIELTRGGTVIEDVGPRRHSRRTRLDRPAPRSASATASASRIEAVDHKYFTDLVQEHLTLAVQVMLVMA